MLHAFIDESERGTTHFILGALIVKDENLAALNTALDDIMAEFASTTQVRRDAEPHGYDMMQQTRDWDGIQLRLAAAVYTRAMRAIDKHAEAFCVECIDRVAQAQRYKRPYNHRIPSIGYSMRRDSMNVP